MVVALVGATIVSTSACSRRVLSFVVDLPEGQGARKTVPPPSSQSTVPTSDLSGLLHLVEDTVRPPIEGTLDPDSVIALLPRDHAGNLDWAAALREGVIKPRSSLPGEPPKDPPPGFDFEFAFDFFFQGPNEMFDAYFPHSTHTEWVDCRQCHSRLFRYRGTEITMADVLGGKYCGECHGKVAFTPATACERCHTGLPQPPDRAQPELIGTVKMKRATEILAQEVRDSLDQAAQDAAREVVNPDSTIRGNASGIRVSGLLPVAEFPHWVHRIRFKCKTCHLDIFEPRAGTNAITMADIDSGEYCGKCHNGTIAFRATMGTCERCHVSPPVQVVTEGNDEAENPGGG